MREQEFISAVVGLVAVVILFLLASWIQTVELAQY